MAIMGAFVQEHSLNAIITYARKKNIDKSTMYEAAESMTVTDISRRLYLHNEWPHSLTIIFMLGLRYFVVSHLGHFKWELSIGFLDIFRKKKQFIIVND